MKNFKYFLTTNKNVIENSFNQIKHTYNEKNLNTVL